MMWLDGEDNSEETEDGEEWSDSSPESRFENYFSSSRSKITNLVYIILYQPVCRD